MVRDVRPLLTACGAAMIGLLAALSPAALTSAPAPQRQPVDLLLVLAADVSRSVDAPKFKLQREGYAAALVDPRVQDAIRSGPNRRIGLLFLEWSGQYAQRVVVDWATVGDDLTAQQFGARLLAAPRTFAERTSISAALDFAVDLMGQAPFEASRRAIDVSGDGVNNSGRDVGEARDQAVARGITVNGLAILSEHPLPWNPGHTHPPGGLVSYFRDNVIGGPGAFVLSADGFESFGRALINKMVAEIAGTPPPQPARRHAAAARFDRD